MSNEPDEHEDVMGRAILRAQQREEEEKRERHRLEVERRARERAAEALTPFARARKLQLQKEDELRRLRREQERLQREAEKRRPAEELRYRQKQHRAALMKREGELEAFVSGITWETDVVHLGRLLNELAAVRLVLAAFPAEETDAAGGQE